MQGTENLTVRVATPNSSAQIRFVVDGVARPVVDVPNTGGWQTWQTVDAGNALGARTRFQIGQLAMERGWLGPPSEAQVPPA